jgi:hypothetical protein
MSMIDGVFHSARGPHAPAKRVLDPRMKSYSYRAMKFKTINSMARIYILPVSENPLAILPPSKWDVLIYLSKYFHTVSGKLP